MNSKPTTNFLMTKWFWIIFTIAVFLGLYLYGLKMISDKTEIALTKKALVLANGEMNKYKIDNTSKTSELSELQIKIKQLNNKIIQKENLISKLSDSISVLANRPPEIVIKYQEKVIYKDKPEPNHEYGKGNGKLVLYTTCRDGGTLSIWIDGEFVGSLNKYQRGSVDCNSSNTISKVLLSGKHHITGKDKSNRTWDDYLIVDEDECQTHGLTCN
jgi:hypothetical protein